MPITEDGILSTQDLDFKDSAAVRAAAQKLSDGIGELAARVEAIKGEANTEELQRGFAELQREVADLKAQGRQSVIDGVLGEGEGRMRAFLTDDGVRLAGTRNDRGQFVPGLLDAVPTCESMRALQQASDDRQLIRHILGPNKPTPEADKAVLRAIKALPRDIREPVERAFVDVAGSGAEWIKPDQLLTLERDITARLSDFEMLFEEQSINAESVISPVLSSRPVPYRYGVPTGDDPANYKTSTFTTSERTFTTDGLAVHIQLARDASEDALFAVLPEVQAMIADGLSAGNADCMINGYAVSAGAHPDTLPGWTADGYWPSTIPGGDIDHRRSFTGLRHRARSTAAASVDGSSWSTVADYMGMRGLLDKPFGLQLNDLVYLVSYDHYLNVLLKLADFLTVDKYGAAATILTGEVGRIGGIPVVPVSWLNKDLTAAGIYDGAVTTYRSMLLVSRSQVKRVTRRGSTVELERDIKNGMIHVVGTARRGLRFIGPATRKLAAHAYKL